MSLEIIALLHRIIAHHRLLIIIRLIPLLTDINRPLSKIIEFVSIKLKTDFNYRMGNLNPDFRYSLSGQTKIFEMVAAFVTIWLKMIWFWVSCLSVLVQFIIIINNLP